MQDAFAVIDAGDIYGGQKAVDVQTALATKNLFMLMQGYYGSAFMAKFATGVMDEATGRHDMGIRSAMAVWRHELAKYAPAVIEGAAVRMREQHQEFPPSLPQFAALCEATKPRKTWAQENRLPALPPPNVIPPAPVEYERKGDRKDWARAILAEVKAGIKKTPTVVRYAREALGHEGVQEWQQ